MINENNLNNLYEGIIQGQILTTSELKKYGFNTNDLTELVKNGTLQRIKRGYYSLVNVDGLFLYGKKLLGSKKFDQAKLCFEKCLEIDPHHGGANYQVFIKAIENGDYERAFECFAVLDKSSNSNYQIDNNFYLFLLNGIIQVPEEYQERASFIRYEDVCVKADDKRYLNVDAENQMRLAAIRRQYPYALKLLNSLVSENGKMTVQNILIKKLLIQAICASKNYKNEMLDLIKNKDYQSLITLLELRKKRGTLSKSDIYVLKLARIIDNIKQTNIIYETNYVDTDDLFEAINARDYDLALTLTQNFNAQNNIENSKSVIYLILSDLCELCQLKQTSSLENSPVEMIKPNEEKAVTLTDIITNLINKNIDEAISNLRIYLESIDKIEYELLIIKLIDLSLEEKDLAFTKPMVVLSSMKVENFVLDISEYIQGFYLSLAHNNYQLSQCYLNVLKEVANLTNDFQLMEVLSSALSGAQRLLEDKKKTEPFVNSMVASKEYPKEKEKQIVPNQGVDYQMIDEEKTGYENIDSEREFIDSKHQILLDRQGVVMLKPMDEKRRSVIHQIVKSYPDLVSFSIGEGRNRRIVLRYKPYWEERKDLKELYKTGDEAYEHKDFDTCIECYLLILQFKEPKSYVYARLGLAYLKKGLKDEAVTYLTIATEKNKEEDGKFDFTELIAGIQGLIDKEDRKPRFKMKVSDFENDVDHYYGIKDIYDITAYINETGMDVESALLDLGYNPYKIDIIRLIYAREFYSLGNYEKGDQFLKAVEQSKYKTPFAIKLLQEIQKNKKFYINRPSENPLLLNLMTSPKQSR